MADVFISTSTYESFGQTIIEAMSSELPILAFKSDGRNVRTAINELVANNKNGILCSYSTKSLSKGLLFFVGLDKYKIKKIGQLNRKNIKKYFSWNKFCESLIVSKNKNIYQTL